MYNKGRTNPFNAVPCEPVKRFHEKKEAKHKNKGYVEFIPKYCKGEKGFSDEEPESIVEALDARRCDQRRWMEQ
jgi:hypothetical protein